MIISVVQFKILQTFKSCIGAMDINTKIIANKETDHLELILPLKQHNCPNLVQIYQELCVLEKHVSHKRKKKNLKETLAETCPLNWFVVKQQTKTFVFFFF